MLTPYRSACIDTERHARAQEIASIRPRMTYADPTAGFGRHLSPFIDPCRKGHTPTVRNGWLVCAVCGAVLAKAGK